MKSKVMGFLAYLKVVQNGDYGVMECWSNVKKLSSIHQF